MQNKGFVKFIAVLLTLICCFYFSFSFVTNKYKKEAEKIEATKGKEAARQYLDQKRGEKVFLGWKTLADCEKLQIGLGLDLKGGVSFLLEVSVPDMIATYAGSTAFAPPTTPIFKSSWPRLKPRLHAPVATLSTCLSLITTKPMAKTNWAQCLPRRCRATASISRAQTPT